MNINESLKQIRAFAGMDGALLGLIYIFSFIFMIYFPQLLWGDLLILSIPFFVGWRVKVFRVRARENVLSFRDSFFYSIYTFVYAAIFFAGATFIYFQWIDNGQFYEVLSGSFSVLENIYEKQNADVAMLKDQLKELQNATSLQMAFMFFVQSVVAGALLSLPIGAFFKRK